MITDLIRANDIPIRIFTLDTGRMFAETYSVWKKTNDRYATKIEAFFPDRTAEEALMSTKGPYSFYDSVENRKECCGIRKVEPLNRALKGQKIWVTGIRAEQSANRQSMPQLEWDEAHQLFKFHPMMDWTFDEVKQYVKDNNVPYNPLHDKGLSALAASPAPVPFSQAKISGPAAGGGKITPRKNAACIPTKKRLSHKVRLHVNE